MIKKKLYAIFALAFILVAALVICMVLRIFLDGEEGGEPIVVEGMFIGPVPGNIRPVILVNGTRFYWVGKAAKIEGADSTNGPVYGLTAEVTYLPESYTEYGSLKEVTKEEPTKDGQMKAGFAASGTIYTSEATPEAVYVWMTSDWTEGAYFRFISAELDNGYRIKWNGQHYRIGRDTCEVIPQVPDTCDCIGKLRYVGRDMIPKQDLTTNAPSDGRSYSFGGREVFYDVNEPDFIYVHEQVLGKNGSVFKCPLWEE